MQPTEIDNPDPDPAELPPGPEDLARRLRSVKNLPTPPAVAMQVLELTRDDDCRMDQLVDVLQSDPVLTAQLMRLANSSLFPGKSEVTNVGQASMKLGFRQLRTMSLSMSLLDEAEGGSRSQFPHELYQRYSLCWSIGAQTIGDRMGLEASELFLGGLLAPMGHMILAACYPELYGRLLVEARGELPLEAREYDLLGSDAPLACAMLLESWELPNSICESLRNLSCVPAEDMPERTQVGAAPPSAAKGDVRDALNFGRLLARTLVSRRPSRYLRELEELASQRYQLSGAALDHYLLSLEPLFKERAELLNITGVETGWVTESLERARAEILFEDGESEQVPDSLTGLASAETFRARLERQLMERRMHEGDPLSLGLIRLELGPKIDLGTRTGEAWLRWSGAHLRGLLREPNDAAHLGEGVFAILVPRASARMLRNFSERLVSGLEAAQEQIPENFRSHLRLSVGAACAEDLRQDPRGQQLWGSTAHLLERARASEGPRRIVCLEIPRRAA
ncbi:MAG: sensor domain-containing diguanylate cyclase [Planctomycetota bacterium]